LAIFNEVLIALGKVLAVVQWQHCSGHPPQKRSPQ